MDKNRAMNRIRLVLVSLLLVSSVVDIPSAQAQSDEKGTPAEKQERRHEGKRRHGGREDAGFAMSSDMAPLREFNTVLGRPTDRSITLSVLSARQVDACVEYGTKPGEFAARTEPKAIRAGIPVEIELELLEPNTRHYYRLQTRPASAGDFRTQTQGTFHTQRAPGSAFTFALQGDSHPERDGKMFDPTLYAQTIRNVAKDPPDFYLMLGDDFSIDRLIERKTVNQPAVDQVYARQRPFLGIVGCSSSLFLVNGNHEHAERFLLDGTENSPAVLAGRTRIQYYPLPVPDGFYTGDGERRKERGTQGR